MNKQKTFTITVVCNNIEDMQAIERLVILLRNPANDRTYVHMVGEDGSCYQRVQEGTPTEMLDSMPGMCLLLLDQPDIVEVSIKRPMLGHPTNGSHYIEDVIKLRRNNNDE